MTKDEAIKLALEAMLKWSWPLNSQELEAITALRQALEQPPNSTTDVVESTDSLSTLLWRDLKTDRQRADWLRLGMGYQTGVVAAAIQQELAMAYERLVGFQKMHATLAQPRQECETCANKRRRLEQAGFLKSPLRGEEKQFFYGQDPNVLPASNKGEINDK